MRKVVILTDIKDVALTEVQLRTLQSISDPIHFSTVNTEDFSVVSGNFLLRLIVDSLESQDIVMIVLDPRLSDRPHNSVGIQLTNGPVIVGPNNGVLSWILKDFQVSGCVGLPENEDTKKYPTFNGKYKFSLAVNELLKGKSFGEIGTPLNKKQLFTEDIEENQIVHIDNYGNLKIYHPRLNCKVGQNISLKFRTQTFNAKFGREFDDVSPGELIVYNGSSLYGLPEVAINKGRASTFFDAKIGDKIYLSPII